MTEAPETSPQRPQSSSSIWGDLFDLIGTILLIVGWVQVAIVAIICIVESTFSKINPVTIIIFFVVLSLTLAIKALRSRVRNALWPRVCFIHHCWSLYPILADMTAHAPTIAFQGIDCLEVDVLVQISAGFVDFTNVGPITPATSGAWLRQAATIS